MTKFQHPGFMVWNPENGPPRFTHLSLESARTEAKRLSEISPETPFYILCPVGYAISHRMVLPAEVHLVDPATMPLSLDDEIPF